MNLKRIEDIITDIKSLKSAKFYLVNGWGIFSFRSDVNFIACRSGARVTDAPGGRANALIQRLNEAVKPVLDQEIKALEDELRTLTNGTGGAK